MGYAYSLYLHLKNNSVSVNINDDVTPGQLIAQGDDTGNSSGNHLHLQIILHNLSNRTLANIDSENRTRNPELWLRPLANTARLVGKVTDNTGAEVRNLTIQYLPKSGGNYTSKTYVNAVLKSDDILFENFATTDINPGSYCLEARNPDTTLYKNLGCHSFVAGRTTYVGLYPIYFPDIRGAASGWDTSIIVRNNSNTATAQVKTTFYYQSGVVLNQRTDSIAPNAITIFTPPTALAQGSAIVVGTQSIAVVVRHSTSGVATGRSDLDNGIKPPGYGDANFEQAGKILYAPAFYNNIYGGFNSFVYIQNTEANPNNVIVEFVGRAGFNPATRNYNLSANETRIIPSSDIWAAAGWVGSLKIMADRPVAAKIYETRSSHTTRSYNASFNGNSTTYVPAAYRLSSGFTTGIVIQNLSSISTIAKLRYCERLVTNPATCPTQSTTVIAPLGAEGVNLSTAPVLDGWSGSVSIQSTNDSLLAIAVTNSKTDQQTGTNIGGYDFSATGLSAISSYLPLAEKNAGLDSRTTGFTIRNVSGVDINVLLAYYYDSSGNLVSVRDLRPLVNGSPVPLRAAQVVGYYQGNDGFLTNGWAGSIVIQADRVILVVMREDTPGLNGTTSAYNGIIP